MTTIRYLLGSFVVVVLHLSGPQDRTRPVLVNALSAREKHPIYIGGFFPRFHDPVYDQLPITVQTAMDHVNNMTELLADYELRLRWAWTDVSRRV